MIETGEISIDDFLDELEQFIFQQVSDVDISGLAVAEYQCTCGGRYVRRRTDKGFFGDAVSILIVGILFQTEAACLIFRVASLRERSDARYVVPG